MNIQISSEMIVIIILSVIMVTLIIYIINLNNKLKKFLIGNKAEDLGDSISNIDKRIKNIEEFRLGLEKYLLTVEKRLKKSVQGTHVIRFNPFKGTGSGGNQSFATAFINEEGDGVIVSSLYSRDRVSIFSKPIKNSDSEYELSGEEKEAIKGALDKMK